MRLLLQELLLFLGRMAQAHTIILEQKRNLDQEDPMQTH
jgi:hypothetical protein